MARKRNKKLLCETMKYIETHPEKWVQWSYRCGTSMCFAGWAAVLAGGKWSNPVGECDTRMKRQGAWPEEEVEERAMRVLGLTEEEAAILFDGSNSKTDLQGFVKNLCEGKEIDVYPADIDY